MPKKIPDYEKKYIKGLRKNDTETVDFLDLKDKSLLKKILNFSKKHGFPEKQIIKEIKENKHFRAVFSKDPGKQKIHENIAAKFIKSLPKVKKFKQLGSNDLALISGALIPKKEVMEMGANRKAKTIDFVWETNNKKIVASHKYTKEGGGSQDNQYRDLQEFISEANRSNLADTYFLAIADGDYYQTLDTSAGISKLDYLKKLTNRQNVFAMTIGGIEKWLNKLN